MSGTDRQGASMTPPRREPKASPAGTPGRTLLPRLAMAAVTATLVLMLVPVGAGSHSTTQGDLTRMDGNPHCADLGLQGDWIEIKVEDEPGLQDGVYNETNGNASISVVVREDGTLADFLALEGEVMVAIAKGGPNGANVYEYDPAVIEDVDLHAPLNNNDRLPGISHLVFCFVEDEEEPPEHVCPTDLEATLLEDGSVLLNWTAAPDSDNTTVYRAIGEGDLELIATLPADQESFLDTETVAGQEHTYEVRAVFGDDETEECPQVMVMVPGDEEPPLPCPTDLRAQANEDTTILLGWTPAPGSDGSNVYRAAGDGQLELVAALGPGEDEYLDEDTEVGVTYTYEVRAVFGEEESADCDQIQVTAIPFFGAAVGALAALGGSGAYVLLRRRRA